MKVKGKLKGSTDDKELAERLVGLPPLNLEDYDHYIKQDYDEVIKNNSYRIAKIIGHESSIQ